ncbi:MAG: MBL fold metallo-hydrolase [Ignavibacteriaceae bacterium]|jgi:glyoxylase-like metal-dependent hydrolase (beta-lactamase superfamily II)
MLKLKVCLFIVISFIASGLNGQTRTNLTVIAVSEDLSITKLQDSVYIFTHSFPWASNGMFVLFPGGKGLLINTPCENSGTESLLGWIGKNFGNLNLTAIVTGFHQDNLGGDEVLLSRKIPVYGADLTAELVKNKGKEFKNLLLNLVASSRYNRFYEGYKKLNLIPPDRLFPLNDGLKLKYDDELVEVYFPGESHTIDNTVVYFHKRKILFGGCMIKGLEFDNPGFTEYANMIEWPRSVQRVMKRFGDSIVVIPGHGSAGGMELLSHMIAVLNKWNNQKAKTTE